MQTFLPYPDYAETAATLDDKRLGRQRIEAYAVLEALAGIESRWATNPCVVMWRGCEFQLQQYALTICKEWRSRGFQDAQFDRILNLTRDAMVNDIWTPENNAGRPWWLGADGFHLSHRSNLVRKDPRYYRSLWPNISDQLPYVWPAARPPV